MNATEKYQRAATLVATVHFLFIGFALLGGFLVIFARWVLWVHIPIATWGAYAFLGGKTCPLTPLEKGFRRKAGTAVTGDGFVESFMPFLKKFIESPRQRELLIGSLFLIWSLLVYLFLWKHSFLSNWQGFAPVIFQIPSRLPKRPPCRFINKPNDTRQFCKCATCQEWENQKFIR